MRITVLRQVVLAWLYWWAMAGALAAPADGNLIMQRLSARNFPLLDALGQDLRLRQLLQQDQVLAATSRQEAIRRSLAARDGLPSLLQHYLASDEDIARTGERLATQLLALPEGRALVARLMAAQRYAAAPDAASYLQQAWRVDLQGLNHTLRVYGLGQPPRYAAIDAASYAVDSPFFIDSAYNWAAASQVSAEAPLWFTPALDFALALMYMQHRDEAVRWWPLADGVNAVALARRQQVDFSRYPYAAVIVLGNGPENADRLSALGKLNVLLGVRQYRAGQAPYLLVSGGNVHPNRTGFNEAIEMKRELMEVYGVPEAAILVEPHARHTTTNLRNAGRLLLGHELGAQRQMKSLVVTHRAHAAYAASAEFTRRCQEELGYQPGLLEALGTEGLLAFTPSALVWRSNPMEPLDP